MFPIGLFSGASGRTSLILRRVTANTDPGAQRTDPWRVAVLESSLDCVILMDAEGALVDINRGTESAFGVKRDDVIGRHLADIFVPPELRARHWAGLRRYLQTGETTILGRRIEVPAWHAPTGRTIAVELSIVRLRDVEPPLFVGHLRNIEGRRRAERRLETTALVSQVFASAKTADDAIAGVMASLGRGLRWEVVQWWTALPDRTAVRLSQTWVSPERQDVQFLVSSASEFLVGHGLPGRVWAGREPIWIPDLSAATDFPRLDAFTRAGLRSGFAFPVLAGSRILGIIEAFSADPQPHEPELLAVLSALGGQLGHFLEELAAQGEREALLARAEEARLTAEKANRAKDEFLGLVSHELRTPLNAIVGWTHMIASGQLSAERMAHALDVVSRNARLQMRLVTDLLDVTRIATGNLQLEFADIDVRRLVIEAAETTAVTAHEAGLTLSVDAGPEPAVVSADASRLDQVVLNLLSNAVKFTPAGGRIHVSLRTTAEDAVIAIADDGPGIEPGSVPHIFERFRQGTASTTGASGGLGLGLWLVREIVRAHGGEVTVESPGEQGGSTFSVRLPRGRVNPSETMR